MHAYVLGTRLREDSETMRRRSNQGDCDPWYLATAEGPS
jgi:hypothetical protein